MEEGVNKGERMAAPLSFSFSFHGTGTRENERDFRTHSTGGIGGVFVESGLYWEYPLLQEGMQSKTVRRRQGTDGCVYINVLELVVMVEMAYVMVVTRGYRPGVEGEMVVRKGDSSAAVRWVIHSGGGGSGIRTGVPIKRREGETVLLRGDNLEAVQCMLNGGGGGGGS